MRLATADLRTRHAKVVQEYMAGKGYPEIRPLGLIAIENDECWYYYYLLPEGLLELEVFRDPKTDRWHRSVASFLTDKAAVRDLLYS